MDEDLYTLHPSIQDRYEPFIRGYQMAYSHLLSFNGFDESTEDSFSVTATSSSSSVDDWTSVVRDLNVNVLKEILLNSLSDFDFVLFVVKILEIDFTSEDQWRLKEILNTHIIGSVQEDTSFQKELNSFIAKEKHENLVVKKEEYVSYHWSERFVNSIGDTSSIVSLEREFNSAVEKLSKLIILEKPLPNYLKSIKLANMGGLAGGEKFITNGILFKFATDREIREGLWLYGKTQRNDILASKAMNNEIVALRALFPLVRNNEIKNLRLPLMSTYSYLGVVICAVSLLPIQSSTLVYGTEDGGKTIYDGTGDDILLRNVELLSKTFNYGSHPVYSGGSVSHISLAADVEIHKVKEQYYILDLGRFFPSNDPCNPFSHLFRPEALRLYMDRNNPLSCDAFSGFGTVDHEIWNERSLNFIERLHEFGEKNILKQFLEKNTVDIPDLFHTNGMNLRFMGIVRKNIYNDGDSLEQLILKEMILRSVKTLLLLSLNNMMKKHVLPVENIYKDKIIKFYEKCKIGSKFWRSTELKKMIQTKYRNSLFPFEEDPDYDILDSIMDPDLKTEIFKQIPQYSRFKGGKIQYKTDILGYMKSCIPKDKAEDEIIQLVSTSNADEDDYEEYIYFSQSTLNDNLLASYFKGFLDVAKSEKTIHMLFHLLLENFGYYEEILQDKFIEILSSMWKCNTPFIYKSALLVYLRYQSSLNNRNYVDHFLSTLSKTDPIFLLYDDFYIKKSFDSSRPYAEDINAAAKFIRFVDPILDDEPYVLSYYGSTDDLSSLQILNEVGYSFHFVNPPEIHPHIVKKSWFTNTRRIQIHSEFNNLEDYRNLTNLNLSGSTGNLKAIEDLTFLTELRLENTGMTNKDLYYLLNKKCLKILDISGNNVSSFPLEVAVALMKYGKLQNLNISHNNIADDGMYNITFIVSLTGLEMSSMPLITFYGAIYLGRLKNLKNLIVDNCSFIGNEEFYFHISRLPLRRLSINGSYPPSNESLYYLRKKIHKTSKIYMDTSLMRSQIPFAIQTGRTFTHIGTVDDSLFRELTPREKKIIEKFKPKNPYCNSINRIAQKHHEILYLDVTESDLLSLVNFLLFMLRLI
eukprot:TRINITY_DN2547_c0_g1_i1.p1 TRINITY_DN2547_c0_g1~~TRINITY_DN2547_c0_g1_i1.p1  ORF type:complete len:1090 (-),score=209.80 TRINITY_DN2547_c0_g1_i1:219-3488(-)